MDGLLSIWNLFSGTLKYAIELPPPKLMGEIKDFNFNEKGHSQSDDESLTTPRDQDSLSEDFNDNESRVSDVADGFTAKGKFHKPFYRSIVR